MMYCIEMKLHLRVIDLRVTVGTLGPPMALLQMPGEADTVNTAAFAQ